MRSPLLLFPSLTRRYSPVGVQMISLCVAFPYVERTGVAVEVYINRIVGIHGTEEVILQFLGESKIKIPLQLGIHLSDKIHIG